MNSVKTKNYSIKYVLYIYVVFYFQTSGMTPLMYAVKDNRTAFIDRMIELGADLGARNNVSYFFQFKHNLKKIFLNYFRPVLV